MQESEVKQEGTIKARDFKEFLAKHQVFFLEYLANKEVLYQIDSKFKGYIPITESGTYALGEFIKAFSDELNRVPKGQNEVLLLLANAVMKAHKLQSFAVEVIQLVEKYPDLIEVIFNHQSTIEELSKEADDNVKRFQGLMEDNNLFFELFCRRIRGNRYFSRTVLRPKVRDIIGNSELKGLLDFIKNQRQTNPAGYEAFQQVIRKPNRKKYIEITSQRACNY